MRGLLVDDDRAALVQTVDGYQVCERGESHLGRVGDLVDGLDHRHEDQSLRRAVRVGRRRHQSSKLVLHRVDVEQHVVEGIAHLDRHLEDIGCSRRSGTV